MAEPILDDIRTEDGHELYLVRPPAPTGAAVAFLHWFDEAPNANRAQYLEEAKGLWSAGAVSLLPQLTFPWQSAPSDTASVLRRVTGEARPAGASSVRWSR